MVVVVVVAGAAVVTAGAAVMAAVVPFAFVGRAVLGRAGRDVVVVMTGGTARNRVGFAVVET